MRTGSYPLDSNEYEKMLYLTVGGLFGYSSVNSIVNLNVPSSNGVSWGPNMTAFHNIMLLSLGAPLTPKKLGKVNKVGYMLE